VTLFLQGVSDRWAYKLRAELPALLGPEIPWELVFAETRRLLSRLEKADSGKLQGPALDFLAAYHQGMTAKKPDGRGRTQANALEGFVTLCQAASFLARGRDER
jgi:hypothetical protein